MKQFWLHPATQVFGYLSLFLILLYGSWSLLNQFVVMPMSLSLMLNVFLETVYCVLLLVLFVVVVQKRSFASTGIVTKGALNETVIGFFLGIIVSGGAILGMYLLGAYKVVALNWQANLVYPFILFFFAAIVEEVIFRVFVFQTCERKWGTVPALVIASTLFGLVHMINTVPDTTVWQQLLGCIFLIFEAGFLLNAVFLINRRIWLPLGLHWAWNFFEGPVFGTIVSGQNFGASLISAQTAGGTLASGGPFGPEGSVPGLVVGIVCGVIATWYSINKGAFAELTET
ncbi:MAG: CPBP family intramembrane metalloprotease [Cyanobacteria bacterium SZAS LIN-5]|nr:CPBP family intramembrane metalloprotease [Cyanobacteria bacterium SZAS LIN-5]RTL44669.1 MAG: CPBP family intramembrane metalloprotease [Candidatus Melainabacteria bacterium]